MDTRLIWDEAKRQSNLRKHGFDFADAGDVLGRMEREVYDAWLENECDES